MYNVTKYSITPELTPAWVVNRLYGWDFNMWRENNKKLNECNVRDAKIICKITIFTPRSTENI
jgi:hypothetical protein